MASVTISLPESLGEFVETQVSKGGYATPADYLLDLVRQAQQQQVEDERLEALLLDGLKSPASDMTAADWEDIRREGLARLAVRKGI